MKNYEKDKYVTRLYENSSARALSDVYGRYSTKKEEAFNYCKRLMDKFNGYDLRILTHNTFIFTAAFQFVNEEAQVMLMYITPSKDTVLEWTI